MKASVRDFASISAANKTQDKAVFVSGEFLSLSLSLSLVVARFYKVSNTFLRSKIQLFKIFTQKYLEFTIVKDLSFVVSKGHFISCVVQGKQRSYFCLKFLKNLAVKEVRDL